MATSSAEHEGIALVKATSEGIGIARIFTEWDGEEIGVMIWADAKAALGIIERNGVGKVRRIDVGILWLQQKWLNKQVAFGKIAGTYNGSYLMTKCFGIDKCEQFVK